MSDIRTPKYYGSPDDERLIATSEDEAIEGILEDYEKDPETLTICGYAPRVPNWKWYTPLEHLLESLDEDYADPDGSNTEPTQAMKDAEAAFLAVIKAEYEVWMCDEVSRSEVNIAEWRKASKS
jgi:hypothetical protein